MEKFIIFDLASSANLKYACDILDSLDIHYFTHNYFTQVLLLDCDYNELLEIAATAGEYDYILEKYSNGETLEKKELAHIFFYLADN